MMLFMIFKHLELFTLTLVTDWGSKELFLRSLIKDSFYIKYKQSTAQVQTLWTRKKHTVCTHIVSSLIFEMQATLCHISERSYI